MNCKTCRHALRRSDWSFQHDGNYAYGLECCLVENERSPYRRDSDSCDKWEEKTEQEVTVD